MILSPNILLNIINLITSDISTGEHTCNKTNAVMLSIIFTVIYYLQGI